MKKVLIPVTNHATLGTTDQANGTYAPELTHVVKTLLTAGIEYDIASIKGGKAPLYGTDIEGDAVNDEVLSNDDFLNKINNTIPVSQINGSDYDAIFYPGGFGLLSDLAVNKDFAIIAAKHYEQGGVVAAVCHGPAALLPITLSNGDKLLASKSVTGFTREEEIDFGTINDIPFLLEESLARSAAQFSKVQPWQEFVIVDQRVITGQNPTSAHSVGQKLVEILA
ncbi:MULTISPECIES: type 1 glutamine amidotransferase domain-containing protein [Vibrio]|uniref:Type 1 glutamine amidotransferase domain-containing protein n=1 Tax=Vibrio neptunius TaxID=170651 RepID=A0ABS3A7H9_9VIBR|nr:MULTISPECIES: type 1 glutamine amidotransferase domain-containing protein [Vibrio]KJY82696.1 thiamine biosynthesis protein ThiJ [Vibrio neptunius]MBN3495588.1 type 1 glutamine amidotransferase domain-containing protein [Vibrio neptunius]MBN3518050.1 type 1 glutamine amidotransferase domain-containing protein [Vibrio neptunius]MBN3552395.1 type 1 glutamine amidotransferase domain-containing protein [Vibrio neptunius]MBN3580431.1 type 1 glutamine amidotransferase domain-containing protein [Vi